MVTGLLQLVFHDVLHNKDYVLDKLSVHVRDDHLEEEKSATVLII